METQTFYGSSDQKLSFFSRLKRKPQAYSDGIREVPLDEINHVITQMKIPMGDTQCFCDQIVQINNGDCVLASFINILTLEAAFASRGLYTRNILEITEAREVMMKLRKKFLNPHIESSSEFFHGLPDHDIINLFSSIYEGSDPPTFKTKHYIEVTYNESLQQAKLDALDVLDQLANEDEYPSGIMAVGAKGHCRVIKRLPKKTPKGYQYLVLDPANHEPIDAQKFSTPGNVPEILKASSIVLPMTTEQMVTYLGGLFHKTHDASVFLVHHPKNVRLLGTSA